LERSPKLDFDEKCAKFAGRIYRNLKSKIPKVGDLLIASSAIAHSKILYTCDSDFETFKEYGLRVVTQLKSEFRKEPSDPTCIYDEPLVVEMIHDFVQFLPNQR